MDKINLTAGKQYLNRRGHRVRIDGVIAVDDVRYAEGYRFQDVHGVPYKADGSFLANGSECPQDLISEYLSAEQIRVVETTTTRTVEVEPSAEELGFFGRIGRAIKNNPKTTVGCAAGTAVAGYGGYNYYNYGSVTGPTTVSAGDAGEVVAAFARCLR